MIKASIIKDNPKSFIERKQLKSSHPKSACNSFQHRNFHFLLSKFIFSQILRINTRFEGNFFNAYFTINKHGKLTRNGNFLVKLPKMKLEFARNSFYYFGAHLYNSLPLEIRKEVSLLLFKNKLREFYDQ